MPAKIKQEVKDQIIKLYFEDLLTMPEIYKKIGVGAGTVCHIIKATGRPARVYDETKKYSAKVSREELKKLYDEGLSAREISKIAGISDVAVFFHLHKRKTKIRSASEANRVYSLNENFFEEIDSPLKAYLLGYFYADGYNMETRNTVKFTQQINDRYAVDLFREAINTEQPVRDKQCVTTYGPSHFAYLYVTNVKMSKDLAKHGCGQAKTFTVTYPTWLREDLHKHFILGLYDGDGSFSVSPTSAMISFSGRDVLLLELQKILMRECSLNVTKLHAIGKIHDLRYGGCDQLLRIYNYLYTDTGYFLPRKKKKLRDYLIERGKLNPEITPQQETEILETSSSPSS